MNQGRWEYCSARLPVLTATRREMIRGGAPHAADTNDDYVPSHCRIRYAVAWGAGALKVAEPHAPLKAEKLCWGLAPF